MFAERESGGRGTRPHGNVGGCFTVRLGGVEDAPGIAGLLNEIIADGRFSLLDTPFSDEEERAYIEGLGGRGFIHVAELPGRGIVGLQTVEPQAQFVTHELDHVATMGTWVAAGHRRAGIGRTLWRATRREARARGFAKVFTDVRADNVDSLAFHAALGFTEVGRARRHARVGDRYVDVVFIERQLAGNG